MSAGRSRPPATNLKVLAASPLQLVTNRVSQKQCFAAEIMWIEIDVYEDPSGLATYSGEAADEDVALITEGKYTKPFLKLDHVFMNITRKPKGEWEEEKKFLMRWGHGERQNYTGHMFTRVDRIVHITPLRAMALRDGSRGEEE